MRPDQLKMLTDNRLSAEARVLLLWLSERKGEDGWVPFSFDDARALLPQTAPAQIVAAIRAIEVTYPHTFERWEEGVLRVRSGRGPALSRPAINPHQRLATLERDGFRCRACGSGADLHIDHVVPLARFGTGRESNLQTLCGHCNLTKGAA